MTQQTIAAIYEKGVFRPLKKPEIPEGQPVKLTVEITSKLSSEEMLKLAAQVYEGLSEAEIDEIEQIARDRLNFLAENTR